ncbi:hypothetical protein CRUP_007212 [Coryphaenoides rupestris]|nr:hypothetical protein CRUP_007212 [Coryphaenoides rupestris]
MQGLRPALGALALSTTGLREADLYGLVNSCGDLPSSGEPVTWERALQLARKPGGRVAMATFTQMVRNLQSLIGLAHSTDDLLTLTNPEVRLAFEDFLLPTETDRVQAHLILSARLWAAADPQGTDTFLHCEADHIKHLPAHLMSSDQWKALGSLLSNYYFLYTNIRHSLVHDLLVTYGSYDENCQSESGGSYGDDVMDCHVFLHRHAPLLTSWPALFLQQALNEPPHSPAHAWAQGLLGRNKGARGVVRLMNYDEDTASTPASVLVSTFSSEPTCVAMNPCAELVVVGTGQGSLHLIHANTGQEVKSLVSSCDGISSCVFLTDVIWRLPPSNGSSRSGNTETGLQVWSASKGHQVASRSSSSPMNCVTFNPDGDLLALGCWDGTVLLWNWLQNRTLMSVSGHEGSVRSLSFSTSSSSTLCSGSLSGEVKLHLWSGGLGCSVATLRQEQGEQAPPRKKLRSSEPPALCLAVAGDCTAVGYHGNGLKLFSLDSEKSYWASEDLRVSVQCLLWLSAPAPTPTPDPDKDTSTDDDSEKAGVALLVSGGADNHLRVWKRTEEEGVEGKLVPMGDFGVQKGTILALAQNSSHLASASDDFTIALWSLGDLTLDPWVYPTAVSLLRGHSRGVTCLAFSPDGTQLLSGGKDQALMVWNMGSSPPALSKPLLHAHKDWITGYNTTEVTPEEMVVATASEDGAVQLWKPFQVEHFCTFQGHSGAIQGVVSKKGCPEFLTVSEDLSLRCWTWEKESAPTPRVSLVTAVCYSQTDDVLLAAYESGVLEIWRRGAVAGRKQASDRPITAICCMPGAQFAVACKRPSVQLWKLVCSPHNGEASLVKLTMHTVKQPLTHLHYCSALIGLTARGVRILGKFPNDSKSMWMVGERSGEVELSFLFTVDSTAGYRSLSFSTVVLSRGDEEEKTLITAITVEDGLIVCGDAEGSMWFKEPLALSPWSPKRPAHSDMITVLRMTSTAIISASYDRTVKMWDRTTKKQVGMFVCAGPVLVLEVNPQCPSELVCGDAQGKLYFLHWSQ